MSVRGGLPVNTVFIDIPMYNPVDRNVTPGFNLSPDEYHYEFKENIFAWFSVRSCVGGEHMVKREDELFLPIPTAMIENPTPGPSQSARYNSASYTSTGHVRPESILARRFNPNYHPNNSYMSYKTRAQFPELVNFTMRGLLGLVVKQLPTVYLPPEMEYLEDNATLDGKSLTTLFLYVLSELLSTGRVFLLAEVDEEDEGRLKFAVYSAESITNWRVATSGSDDARLYEIVLTESNRASGTEIAERSIIHLAQTNKGYQSKKVTINNKSKNAETTAPTKTPNYKGTTMDVIPGVVVGSTNLTPKVDKSPLYGISRTSLQIYQLDADLRQAEYMTCNPTLVISGIDADELPTVVGSTVAIALPDTNSKAYYTETDTSALNHIRSRIVDLHDTAMEQGASLLGGQKNVSESGEALRIRQATSSATLVSVTYTAGRGIQQVLDFMAEWMGLSEKALFEPNTEFTTYAMTAQEQLALVNSWMTGAISDETLLDNFRKAGMLQAGDTISDEIARGGGKKAEASNSVSQKVAGIIGGANNTSSNQGVSDGSDGSDVNEEDLPDVR